VKPLFAIVGCGRAGDSLAEYLTEAGYTPTSLAGKSFSCANRIMALTGLTAMSNTQIVENHHSAFASRLPPLAFSLQPYFFHILNSFRAEFPSCALADLSCSSPDITAIPHFVSSSLKYFSAVLITFSRVAASIPLL